MKKYTFLIIFGLLFSIHFLSHHSTLIAQNDNSSSNSGQCPSDNQIPGLDSKDSSSPYEYNGNFVVTSVGVKAGSDVSSEIPCTILTPGNTSNGCYTATWLASNNVLVFKSGNDSNTCKDISHVVFYYSPEAPNITPLPTCCHISPSPTNTTFPSNTPTLTPTPVCSLSPTLTESPTLSPTDTVTLTPTPTTTATISSTPTPTQTSAPSSTPTPTSSSSDNNNSNNDNNSSSGSSSSSSPGVGGGESSNPVVAGIVQTSTRVLGATDNYNPLIEGIRQTYAGQILGDTTLANTADTQYSTTKSPTNNSVIQGSSILIPRINLMESIYQGSLLGDQITIGHQEVLKVSQNNFDLYYAHNAADKFGNLYKLSISDKVILQNNSQLNEYKVIAKKYLSSTTTIDQLISDAPDSSTIALMTCSATHPNQRIIIYLSL